MYVYIHSYTHIYIYVHIYVDFIQYCKILEGEEEEEEEEEEEAEAAAAEEEEVEARPFYTFPGRRQQAWSGMRDCLTALLAACTRCEHRSSR